MKRKTFAASALASAAVAATPVVGAASSVTAAERVSITAAKKGIDGFVLTPLTSGPVGRDSGTVDYCCWKRQVIVRDGQEAEINDPRVTLTGKRGTLVLRNRIEWIDSGNGYTIGTSTWKVIRGTGGYAHVAGGGRGAGLSLPSGPKSFRFDGYLRKP